MIVTKSVLREDASINRLQVKVLFESIQKKRLDIHYSSEIWVFLSHKHGESDVLTDVVSILQQHGSNVYVDWMDGEMPLITSGETAQKIKDKISSCRKFMLVATEAAISSKWCNWELGLGDAKKYLENIAVFPIADTFSEFSGKEYLKIYPTLEKVERGSYPDGSTYHIKFPQYNRIDSLKSWLLKK